MSWSLGRRRRNKKKKEEEKKEEGEEKYMVSPETKRLEYLLLLN